ncbi:MAG: hypothetical protein CVU59_10190 [Deltaproteobacteria bacterium HGW-Deltaproteobacteria-17]|nr:MAG: hypothetical protein CVU59_10190 [Deltaproteobacteria bacterium HGW-Deltaproteobacteria-17]
MRKFSFLVLFPALMLPACDTGTPEKKTGETDDPPLIIALHDDRPRPDGESCVNELGECVLTGDGVECFCLGEVLDYAADPDFQGDCGNSDEGCLFTGDLELGLRPPITDPTTCAEHLYNRCSIYIDTGISKCYSQQGVCTGYGNLITCNCMTGDYLALSVLNDTDISCRELPSTFCPVAEPVESCERNGHVCTRYAAGFACDCAGEGLLEGMTNFDAVGVSVPRYLAENDCDSMITSFCSWMDGK